MSTELTEGQHRGEFLVTEANGSLSREVVTILAGESLQPGQVIGKVSVGTVTAEADSGNTGNGTVENLSVGDGARSGKYVLTCIEPATGAGTFTLEDPAGVTLASIDVGTPYTGVLNFTLAAGTTDFAAGDRFVLTVTGGSGKYRAWNPANADGSQTALAIVLDAVDATSTDQDAVIIARHAEVNASELVWFNGATDGQKKSGLNQLKSQQIIGR